MAIKQTFHVDRHSPSDNQVRETWYGDEVQRCYLSTIHIESSQKVIFCRTNTAEPEENVTDTHVWRELPGTNYGYQFALKRTTITVGIPRFC
jgi:hypothetical protein